jgi:hypothetical protein
VTGVIQHNKENWSMENFLSPVLEHYGDGEEKKKKRKVR